MKTNQFCFDAIGTSWKIDLPDTEESPADKIVKAVRTRIDEFDRNYSRFRADSLVSLIAKSAGTYQMPDDARPMIELYEKMLGVTKGKMTPLVGQVLSDAGYDASYSLSPKSEINGAKKWNEVIKYNPPMLEASEPVLLDFGAIGKGYLIDIVAEILKEKEIKSFVIDAGGDIAYRDASGKMLKVGLEDPDDATKVIGIAEIKNQSICGSAGNRRKWDKFHHIMDPDTAKSPVHIKALWVVAESTMLADALTTALFFVEPDELLRHFDFEYAIVYANRGGVVSAGFPGNFFNN
jgi:thiamine biosynthesis lipoprotein